MRLKIVAYVFDNRSCWEVHTLCDCHMDKSMHSTLFVTVTDTLPFSVKPLTLPFLGHSLSKVFQTLHYDTVCEEASSNLCDFCIHGLDHTETAVCYFVMHIAKRIDASRLARPLCNLGIVLNTISNFA